MEDGDVLADVYYQTYLFLLAYGFAPILSRAEPVLYIRPGV